MGKIILKDCYISVDGNDLSDHVSSVEVTLSKDDVDTTNFSGGGREHMAGLKDDQFKITFQQDFDAASVDSILYPLWDDETEFPVVVRAHSTAVGPDNPSYSGTCVLMEYAPLSGAVGKLSETDVKLLTQRAGIARATA